MFEDGRIVFENIYLKYIHQYNLHNAKTILEIYTTVCDH